MHVMLSLTP